MPLTCGCFTRMGFTARCTMLPPAVLRTAATFPACCTHTCRVAAAAVLDSTTTACHARNLHTLPSAYCYTAWFLNLLLVVLPLLTTAYFACLDNTYALLFGSGFSSNTAVDAGSFYCFYRSLLVRLLRFPCQTACTPHLTRLRCLVLTV